MKTEWWQRGPIPGVPPALQPVAHILLQVGESVDAFVAGLSVDQWNARPGGVASVAFHVRHIAGVIDRLFTYARGEGLSESQFATLRLDEADVTAQDVPMVVSELHERITVAVDELRQIDPDTLGEFRGVGRAQLPSTVIGCLVHGAEHAMRHVGQLSVTARIVAATPTVISVMLAVPDAVAALAWYSRALGAMQLWNLGSVIGLEVAGAPIFLGEPSGNGWETPATLGAPSVRIEVFCDDPDIFIARALEAGAIGTIDHIENHPMPWGTHRQGSFVDPFGHKWLVGDRSPLAFHAQ